MRLLTRIFQVQIARPRRSARESASRDCHSIYMRFEYVWRTYNRYAREFAPMQSHRTSDRKRMNSIQSVYRNICEHSVGLVPSFKFSRLSRSSRVIFAKLNERDSQNVWLYECRITMNDNPKAPVLIRFISDCLISRYSNRNRP